MIPLLSRQMSLLQAGERLGRAQKAVLSWLLAFRSYLLELDPTGHWEARVRLGVRIAPHAQCVRCGFDGGFESGGFDPQGRRRIRCPHCGRSRLLDALQEEGLARDGVVMHDAIDTAVRHRRKSRPEAIAPPVARTAAVDEATQDVRPRRYLAEVPVHAKTLPPGPPDHQEDATLSAFLLAWVREALSQNRDAGRCPWCASEQTQYHTLKRPSGLPGFKCRGCLGYFSRVTNTPLVSPQARVLAHQFVPMLGWRDSTEVAAEKLGISAALVKSWVLAWRRHLLLLDPSGAMESRVRLGLPIEVPLPHRIRIAQRKRWLTRAWRRGQDGFSYLPADGFWVKVGEEGHGWCYEVRAIGVDQHLGEYRAGFGSRDEARLAAFDFITGLLPDLENMAPMSLLEEVLVA